MLVTFIYHLLTVLHIICKNKCGRWISEGVIKNVKIITKRPSQVCFLYPYIGQVDMCLNLQQNELAETIVNYTFLEIFTNIKEV